MLHLRQHNLGWVVSGADLLSSYAIVSALIDSSQEHPGWILGFESGHSNSFFGQVLRIFHDRPSLMPSAL